MLLFLEASLLPEPSDLEVIGPDLTSGAQGSGPQQSSGVRGYVEILSDIKVRSMKVFESIELFARRTQGEQARYVPVNHSASTSRV